MRIRLTLASVILVTLACQVIPTPPPLKSTPRLSPTPPSVYPAETLTAAAPFAPAATGPALTAIPGELPDFPYQPGRPYTQLSTPEADAHPVEAASGIDFPVSADQIVNPQVIAGLTLRQQAELLRTGFTVVRTQEDDFEAVRRRVAVCFGQPYYLTSDAAFNALDTTLDRLLPVLEKEELHRRMLTAASAALKEILAYQPLVEDERLEAEVGLGAAYLAVGVRLLDPQVAIDPNLQGVVEAQIAQIDAGRGVEESVLIPGYRDDFRLYRPTAHYTGDSTLRNYWRGRTWFSRAGFAIDGEAGRAALAVTLALRRAMVDPLLSPEAGEQAVSAAQVWADVYATLRFLHGPGLDYGPAEYASLMDRIYDPGLTLVSIADAERWELMKVYARELPPTEANPLISELRAAAGAPQGWSWLPIDLRFDNAILASLEGKRPLGLEGERPLPSGLEVIAALGSPAATKALNADAPRNKGYLEAIEKTRSRFAPMLVDPAQPAEDWSEILWMQAFRSSIQTEAETAPADEGFRFLNSALGGWIDLRRLPGRDLGPSTAASASDPQPTTPAALDLTPGVYYRLAQIAFSLAQGLTERGLTGVYTPNSDANGLRAQIQNTFDLGDRLQRLGNIAAAVSRGESIEEDDQKWITAALAPTSADSSNCRSDYNPHALQRGLIPLQSTDGSMQYAGIGGVDRIYTLMTAEDQVYVAQGAIYSVYEFPEARYGKLDDFGWRQMLAFGLIEAPAWTEVLYLPDGSPVDSLLFHIGYHYRVSGAAGRINLRLEPGRATAVVTRIAPGDAFTIIDGPSSVDGLTWWQVSVDRDNDAPAIGWLAEDPTIYSLDY